MAGNLGYRVKNIKDTIIFLKIIIVFGPLEQNLISEDFISDFFKALSHARWLLGQATGETGHLEIYFARDSRALLSEIRILMELSILKPEFFHDRRFLANFELISTISVQQSE